jgi:hypothetical protein
MDDQGYTPLKEPMEIGYLAAADGIGGYPCYRYKGTDRIVVHNLKEEEAAARDGFHQADFGKMDAPRQVDYGYDLSRLNPMQLKLYASEIGLDLDPDLWVGEAVREIQEFMLTKPSYEGRVTLIAQAIEFDLDGAQDEIREAIRSVGGYLV